jgi:hypothetical protein
LQASDPCCGENTTFGPSDDYGTDIDPGVGDDPTHYGETEVADWDEWLEYLCHSANAWVDTLIHNSNTAAAGLESGGISVALLGGILAALSFFGLPGLIAIGFIMLAVAGLTASVTHTMVENAAGDIEAAREDIVCAILRGRSLSDAVEEAVGGGAVWDYFYSLVLYDSAQALLYEGGDGESYLDAQKDDSCVCEQLGEFLVYTDWEDEETNNWDYDEGIIDTFGNGVGGSVSWRGSATGMDRCHHSVNSLIWEIAGHEATEGDTIRLHRVKFTYKMNGNPAGRLRTNFEHDGGDEVTNHPFVTALTEVEIFFDPPLESTDPSANVVKFTPHSNANHGWVDNITLDFDATIQT